MIKTTQCPGAKYTGVACKHGSLWPHSETRVEPTRPEPSAAQDASNSAGVGVEPSGSPDASEGRFRPIKAGFPFSGYYVSDEFVDNVMGRLSRFGRQNTDLQARNTELVEQNRTLAYALEAQTKASHALVVSRDAKLERIKDLDAVCRGIRAALDKVQADNRALAIAATRLAALVGCTCIFRKTGHEDGCPKQCATEILKGLKA